MHVGSPLVCELAGEVLSVCLTLCVIGTECDCQHIQSAP